MIEPLEPHVPAAALAGRYHLRQLLGVGGSASVFRAVVLDDGASDPVAVKILHPHLCATEAARASFLREARHTAELQHPNVAKVLDSGLHESGGITQAWIALEMLEGGSLSERIARRGPMTPAEAAEVLGGVLDGLGAAHAAGLVHRDVSPSNILLRTDVTDRQLRAADVCLVDFGLADLAGRDTTGGDILRITSGDGVIGNASYLSPEQALGRPVTAAGDVYQTGAVLHFLLTGQAPYPRTDRTQTAHAHITAPPPVPSALVAAAHPLDRVVTRAMAKEPAHRYRDVDHFRVDMDAAIHDATVRQPAAPTQTTRRLPGARQSATGIVSTFGRTASTGVVASAPVVRSRGGGLTAFLIVVMLIAGVAAAGSSWSTAWTDPGHGETTKPASTPIAESSIDEPAPFETPPPAVSSTPPPSPIPIAALVAVVPNLSGTLAEAQTALARSGLSAGTLTRIESSSPLGWVLAQRPAPGESIAQGGTVELTIASGRNVVPDVTTLDIPSAVAALQGAGFAALAPSASPGSTILATDPVAGTIVGLGTPIVLRVVIATPTPDPTVTTPPGGAG